MRAVIEFDLPEESTEHQDAIDGWKWKSIVSALYDDILRPCWKYGDDEAKAAFAEEIWQRVSGLMDARRLTIDD